jgi:hypothetical protein
MSDTACQHPEAVEITAFMDRAERFACPACGHGWNGELRGEPVCGLPVVLDEAVPLNEIQVRSPNSMARIVMDEPPRNAL